MAYLCPPKLMFGGTLNIELMHSSSIVMELSIHSVVRQASFVDGKVSGAVPPGRWGRL